MTNEQVLKIDKDGTKRWYLNGKWHREDGPAVEWANGTKCWYINNLLHRLDGPAIEWADGDKSWYLNGEQHRIDGPAIEWSDGYKEWWIDGKLISKNKEPNPEEWRRLVLEYNLKTMPNDIVVDQFFDLDQAIWITKQRRTKC